MYKTNQLIHLKILKTKIADCGYQLKAVHGQPAADEATASPATHLLFTPMKDWPAQPSTCRSALANVHSNKAIQQRLPQNTTHISQHPRPPPLPSPKRHCFQILCTVLGSLSEVCLWCVLVRCCLCLKRGSEEPAEDAHWADFPPARPRSS